MRHIRIIIAALVFYVSLPCVAHAAVEAYTGKIEIIDTSGKGCGGIKGTYSVSLVIRDDDNETGVTGYFEGDKISAGRFSGSDRSRLTVRYPYQDEFKAGGHFLAIMKSDKGITTELRDRHIEPTVDDCNFDLARMTLKPAVTGLSAAACFSRMADNFEAQLARSGAFFLARAGRYEAALPLYERALPLAESALGKDSPLLSSYIVGLANAYIKLGGFEDFDRLYDKRFATISDEGVRAIFTGYRVRSLLQAGKSSLKREEYTEALKAFQLAYTLQPQYKETIAAVMTAYLRTGKQDDAIAFLEGSMKRLDSDADRRELLTAISQVYYLKSVTSKKNGKSDEAEKDLKKAIELDPNAVLYQVALARLRHKLGSLAEAETLLARALDRFRDEASRREIISARERIRQTDMILTKLHKVGR